MRRLLRDGAAWPAARCFISTKLAHFSPARLVRPCVGADKVLKDASAAHQSRRAAAASAPVTEDAPPVPRAKKLPVSQNADSTCETKNRRKINICAAASHFHTKTTNNRRRPTRAGRKVSANLRGLVKKEAGGGVWGLKGLKPLQLCCVPQHWVIRVENKPPQLPLTRPPADTVRVPTSICCLHS